MGGARRNLATVSTCGLASARSMALASDYPANEDLRPLLAGYARSSLPRRKRTQLQATALLPLSATSAPWTSAPRLRCASSRHVAAWVMPQRRLLAIHMQCLQLLDPTQLMPSRIVRGKPQPALCI